jgi:hypothetical protein
VTTSFKGVVHGRVIELDQAPGLPDGQEVSVRLETIAKGAAPVTAGRVRDLPQWEGEILGRLSREEIYDERV